MAPEARFIGLMSGTSLDGVDAALVDLGAPRPRLLASLFHPYPEEFRDETLALLQPGRAFGWSDVARLDHAIAEHFVSAVKGLLMSADTPPNAVRAIGSHGQTVWHAPESPEPNSLQLGDPARLAVATGIPVVADFRRSDIAAGGQGAPLVPAFHAALFHDKNETRAVLNIGGIANLTCLPAYAGIPVTGFDTGPGNLLLDAWCRKHTGEPFDRDGAWARTGRIDAALLASLLAEPYFSQPPPKSTGREHFHLDWLAAHPRARLLPPEDVQATLVALTAHTVADALYHHCSAPVARLIVCGGGARNPVLMEALRNALPDVTVETSDDWGVPAEWMEAMAFAWLAKQRLEGRPGNLPEVTGARRAVVLGGLYMP